MISSNGMDNDQVEIKKEISRTFLRMGLISLVIGLLAILIGVLIEKNADVIASLNLVPLLISVPFIVLINWLLMRRLIKKIRYQSLGHD